MLPRSTPTKGQCAPHAWLAPSRRAPDACRVDDITEQAVAAELASGKAYLHTAKDVNNRPVIVIRVQKHVTGKLRECLCRLTSALSHQLLAQHRVSSAEGTHGRLQCYAWQLLVP